MKDKEVIERLDQLDEKLSRNFEGIEEGTKLINKKLDKTVESVEKVREKLVNK